MTVYVKADPTAGQRTGDWTVVADGPYEKTRHRTKANAKQRARKLARKIGTDIRTQQSSTGQWFQGPSY